MNKIKPPIVTVLVVAVFAVGLLLVNQARTPAVEPAAAPPAAPPPSGAPAAAAPTTTAADPTDKAVYTGHTNAPRIAVAVAVEGDKAAGYLCDGKIEAWLEGSRSGDTVTLRSKNGAYRLTGTVAGGRVEGTVSLPGGRSTEFDAAVAGPPAGLYERRAGTADRAGWIVLPDGSQVGARTVDGVTTGAPPLDTSSQTATVDGQSVPVSTLDVGGAG